LITLIKKLWPAIIGVLLLFVFMSQEMRIVSLNGQIVEARAAISTMQAVAKVQELNVRDAEKRAELYRKASHKDIEIINKMKIPPGCKEAVQYGILHANAGSH